MSNRRTPPSVDSSFQQTYQGDSRYAKEPSAPEYYSDATSHDVNSRFGGDVAIEMPASEIEEEKERPPSRLVSSSKPSRSSPDVIDGIVQLPAALCPAAAPQQSLQSTRAPGYEMDDGLSLPHRFIIDSTREELFKDDPTDASKWFYLPDKKKVRSGAVLLLIATVVLFVLLAVAIVVGIVLPATGLSPWYLVFVGLAPLAFSFMACGLIGLGVQLVTEQNIIEIGGPKNVVVVNKKKAWRRWKKAHPQTALFSNVRRIEVFNADRDSSLYGVKILRVGDTDELELGGPCFQSREKATAVAVHVRELICEGKYR